MFFTNVVVGVLAAQAVSNTAGPRPAQAGKYAVCISVSFLWTKLTRYQALMAIAALPVSGAPLMGLIEPRFVSASLLLLLSLSLSR